MTHRVMLEWSDKVFFIGSYDACKQWIDQNYNDDLLIISIATGRVMSVVW